MNSKKYLTDYLSGKPILKTPEEPNRQNMLRILHEDYGYPKNLMIEEYGVKRSPSDTRRSVPVDIAVFENENDIKHNNPKIFVETKKPNYDAGKDQLKEYMTFERNLSFGIWYNGLNEDSQSIAYFKKTFENGYPKYNDTIDVPRHGYSNVSQEIKYSDLKPTNNLKPIFGNLRGFIAANATGTTRDEMILEQLSMIIISKLYDEKFADKEFVQFRVVDNNAHLTAERIKKIFNEARERWDNVFSSDDNINLDDRILMQVVAQLQNYSLIDSPRNVISDAFESIITYATKGSQGQFFTPENVAKLMVAVSNPSEDQTVFDPASGTASFLTNSMFHVWDKIDNSGLNRQKAKDEKKEQYATNHLYGIEKDSFLAKISKAFMAVLGDGRSEIFVEDSLNESHWKLETSSAIKNKQFNIILTNPPFGKDVKLSPETKNKFDFGNQIELAFIEESLSHLANGGILGVILPETIFHSPSKKKVREELLYSHNITHIIDLPHDTFRPYNNAKTDIIFLQKGRKQQKNITMINIKEIGHNHLGKEKFRLNPDTLTFTDQIADDIPEIIHSLNNRTQSKFIKSIPANEVLKNDLLVARPYFNSPQEESSLSLGELFEKGIIKVFSGHGSPRSYLKGLGTHPYVRVKDIVNLEIAHNRLDDIPDNEYNRLYSDKKELHAKDIVFVRRGSYRIGDVGILYNKDLNSILTREILIIRVMPNQIGLTPFNLLGILNSPKIRSQFSNLVLMDTTLPNMDDRWKLININVNDKDKLSILSDKIKYMYNKRNKFWKEYSDLFGNNG